MSIPVPLVLKVYKGEALVEAKPFERNLIKIGRLSSAHLCIDEARASRIHSVLNVERDGRLSLVHMGGSEGTFLNGRRVSKSYVVFGDEIRIGETRILIVSATQGGRLVEPSSGASESGTGDSTVAEALGDGPPSRGLLSSEVRRSERILRSAPRDFGGYVPRGRVARPAHINEELNRALKEGKPLALQLRLCWGDSLLQVAEVCDFTGALRLDEPWCALLALPGSAPDEGGVGGLKLGEWREGPALQFDSSLGRQRLSLELERERGESGEARLNPGEVAHLTLEGGNHLSLELSFRERSEQVPFSLKRALDPLALGAFAAVGGALLLFALIAARMPEPPPPPFNPEKERAAIARIQLRAEQQRLKAKSAPLKGGAKQPGSEAERSAQEEGSAGKREVAVDRRLRSAPKAIDIDAKELVKNSGLLKGLSATGAGLSTVFGDGGLSGDLHGAIGNLKGLKVGDSGGIGGLGLKGGGAGGGGVGKTIGIGAVGTKGRGGGEGEYGQGAAQLGPKRGVDPAIAESEPNVEGALDRELIRQVIRRNIAQIRTCYEVELQVKPHLAGRVLMRFVVAASGEVQSAAATEGSTLSDARVKDCIASRIRGWRFPSPKGGGSVIVTYPFLFKQSGE